MTAALDRSMLPQSAKPLSGRPLPMWAAEVGQLPARVLLELPAPPVLGLHVPGVDGVLRVSVDGEGEPGEIGLDRDEWHALVVGVEADRVWPRDLVAMLRRKATEPTYRLDLLDALAGGQPDPEESWDLAAVLDRLDAALLSVEASFAITRETL